ncbi:hypothetical protein HanXRQr2_Chr15g0676791 [Helianthus annuus]|uniref:Late embryogenesis abundant protein (LEA) family protein n=1 Tax=Helianthus annuus TaxID=4232 RepID=A0A251S602_HELAN|nr:hypothetical protein HanXRQr2_Chr15g0676791 [Helianthus annuus]KAJ0647439.1 hypothetical protein HanLR1_Chr15g0561891 [Helianthus annuus]
MAGVAAARFQSVRTMVRATSCFRVLSNNPTLTQVRFFKPPSSPDAVKQDIDELKEKTAAVASQCKEVAGKETITEKATKSATEAWNATKDAATKVQKTVTGEAAASAATVKENCEVAKKSMNTKK